MKKTNIIKYGLIILLLIILYFFINNLVLEMVQKPVEMVAKASIWQDLEIVNYNLGPSSVISWDENKLRFYNLQGGLIKEISSNGYFTNIYFFDDDVALLDKQLNILYIYNSLGEEKDRIELIGSVYTVKKMGSKYYILKKENKDNKNIEAIYSLNRDGKDTQIYETDKFIVNFSVDGSKILVSEISTENFAYKSSISDIDGSNIIKYDFDNETVLDMKRMGGRLIAITNKNIYALYDNRKEKVEFSNFKDYYFDNDRIIVLYSNKLEIFDNRLRVVETYDIDITAMGFFKHNDGYFVYGPTDIMGYIGQKRQFKKSFDSIVYGMDTNDKGILVSYKYRFEVYGFEDVKESED